MNSLELVQNYVSRGYGYGLSVDIPSIELAKGVRRIPLSGFPPLVVGLLHSGKLKPVAARFAEEAVKAAAKLSKKRKG